MLRRPDNLGDAQTKSSLAFRDRPSPARIAGLTILMGTALMFLGGAYREQAGLIRSGLLLLAMGPVLLPGDFLKTLGMKVAFYALALIGVFYAVTT
jgi:hypothetical protein